MQETYLWGIAAVVALLLIVLLVWRGTARKTVAGKPATEALPPEVQESTPASSDTISGTIPDASPDASPNTVPGTVPGTSPVPPAAKPAAGSPFLAAPEGARDDLRQIKGIGPRLAQQLEELGVFHFRQIAGWTPGQLADVDAKLGKFSGRPARDQWQAQARLLAAGDIKAYEKLHGKLRSE